jgi:hypothetical protein
MVIRHLRRDVEFSEKRDALLGSDPSSYLINRIIVVFTEEPLKLAVFGTLN